MGAPGDARPAKKAGPPTGKPTTKVGTPLLPPLKPPTPEALDITPAQEAEVLAAMKESSPDHYYAYLIAAKKSDPKLYRRALGHAWRTYEQWRDAPKNVREQVLVEREVTIEIGKLVHALRQGKDPSERAELSGKLKRAVGRKFDAEVVIRDYRLLQFELRVKSLREELKERVSNRQDLVEKEVSLWLERARHESAPPP